MTHPDIIFTEIYGSHPSERVEKVGECLYCESVIYDDSDDVVESTDGMFCDMDCCCEYYEIRKMFD